MCDSRLSADDHHDQASRMSALDLYEDLLISDNREDGDRVLSMPEILSEKRSLEEQNTLLLQQLIEAKMEAQKFREEKANLQKNFNSLLATAKAELERKNSLLSRYLEGSEGPAVRPATTRATTTKYSDHSDKKKGLLDLYKGRRVNVNELKSQKPSNRTVPASSTALLQHRGEKMVGVATLVIGSSFENAAKKAAINSHLEHQSGIGRQTDRTRVKSSDIQGPISSRRLLSACVNPDLSGSVEDESMVTLVDSQRSSHSTDVCQGSQVNVSKFTDFSKLNRGSAKNAAEHDHLGDVTSRRSHSPILSSRSLPNAPRRTKDYDRNGQRSCHRRSETKFRIETGDDVGVKSRKNDRPDRRDKQTSEKCDSSKYKKEDQLRGSSKSRKRDKSYFGEVGKTRADRSRDADSGKKCSRSSASKSGRRAKTSNCEGEPAKTMKARVDEVRCSTDLKVHRTVWLSTSPRSAKSTDSKRHARDLASVHSVSVELMENSSQKHEGKQSFIDKRSNAPSRNKDEHVSIIGSKCLATGAKDTRTSKLGQSLPVGSKASAESGARSSTMEENVPIPPPPSESNEVVAEGSEPVDFMPDLELDYDEDSLMNKEIMQPDDITEKPLQKKDAFSVSEDVATTALGTESTNPSNGSTETEVSCSLALPTVKSQSRSVSARRTSNPQKINPETPGKTLNGAEGSYPQVVLTEKSLVRSNSTTQNFHSHRLEVLATPSGRKAATNSSVGAESVFDERFSSASLNVEKLLLTPKYQPQVCLIDIRKSPVMSCLKRKVSYELGSEKSEKKKRMDATEEPLAHTDCNAIPFSKSESKSMHVNETTMDVSHTGNRAKNHLDVKLQSEHGNLPNLELTKSKGTPSSLCLEPNPSTVPSVTNFPSPKDFEGPSSGATSASSPAKCSLMDVGMEVEVETSPSSTKISKRKSKKSKKRTLKVKMKAFKRERGNKPKTEKNLTQSKDPADKQQDAITDISKICFPEAPPALSQWLDSAKKKRNGKKMHQKKGAVQEMCSTLPTMNKEFSIPEKPSGIAILPDQCLEKKRCLDQELAQVERDRIETVNAVASICEPMTDGISSTSQATFSSAHTESTPVNPIRSYNNAALKWLFCLSLQKLKSLSETDNQQPLDLSCKKMAPMDKLQDIPPVRRSSTVVNLFSGTSDPKSKGSSRNHCTASTSQERCAAESNPLESSVDPKRKSPSEDFDELLRKHTKHQRASMKKRKKVDDKSEQLPKTKTPRRVALERVEMPEPELNKTGEIVSPLSRSVWMTSLDKCQERRKQRARWSSEVSELEEAVHSSGEQNGKTYSFNESVKDSTTSQMNDDVTPKKLRIDPVLPDSVLSSQHTRPVSKTCQPEESCDSAHTSSGRFPGDIFTDASSSSWQLNEESKSRFYSFAKAVSLLSPLKLSPDRVVPPDRATKNDVRRRVLQSP